MSRQITHWFGVMSFAYIECTFIIMQDLEVLMLFLHTGRGFVLKRESFFKAETFT